VNAGQGLPRVMDSARFTSTSRPDGRKQEVTR
jgi:hypothetical protein